MPPPPEKPFVQRRMPLELGGPKVDGLVKLLQTFRSLVANMAISHEECTQLRGEALQLAQELGQRPASAPPDVGALSPFRLLAGLDELRLVTDRLSQTDFL